MLIVLFLNQSDRSWSWHLYDVSRRECVILNYPTIRVIDGSIVSRRVMIEEACVIVACIDCHVQQVTVNDACLHVDAEDLLLHGALEDDSTSLLRSME